jgi:DNA-binding beta-propeller fold protein YncE
MNFMDRRRFLRSLGLGAVLGQSACHNQCGERVERAILVFFGQEGSLIVWLSHVLDGTISRPLSVGPPVPQSSGFNGISAGTVSGPRPASLGGSSGTAMYLLDTLGDGEVDGRVYAIDVDGEVLQLRGEVGLRPIDNDAPFIALRHIALSNDGSTIAVSQEGAPSQWVFIDAASIEISSRVMAPQGQLARRAIFSPDGKLAYVAAATSSATNSPVVVHVVDVAANSIIHTFDLPENTPIADLAVTPDQGLLIGVAGRFIHAFDLRTGTYSGAANVLRPAGDPQGAVVGRFTQVVMHPNGAEFYAGPIEFFEDGRYAVSAFDVQSLAQTKTMTVEDTPATGRPLLSLSASGGALSYAVQLGTLVQTFDTASGAEIDRAPVEGSFRLTSLVTT